MISVLARMSAASWAGIGLFVGEKTFCEDLIDVDDINRFLRHYAIITKLITRMQKYSARGVTIADAPVGALDWVVCQYSWMDYCG